MIEAMKYTKWITVLFCLLGLAACRQDAPRFRIGVAQCIDDSWRHKMNDEILREAMFYDGVSVEIRSAADDNRKQAEDVHYFIDKGVDLLIISANEAAPMTPIVEEAYQKGIPVILVDRKILSDKYTAYIGADNYEIGRIFIRKNLPVYQDDRYSLLIGFLYNRSHGGRFVGRDNQ